MTPPRSGHGVDVLRRPQSAQFRNQLSIDEATWARGRGWALWKALVTILRAEQHGRDEYADARRFGWRHDPYEVIEHVLADHRRLA